MKKIILLFVAVLAGFTTTLSAGNGKSIYAIITKELKVPAALNQQKLNEKVNVQFKIAENGTTTVLNVETENQALKEYINTQFPKLNFNTKGEKLNGTYIIDINFKVL
jgi:phosphoenolpyruvate-protein kinase (PTS system EI component)